MDRPARLDRLLPFLVLTVFLDLVGFGIILPLLPSYASDMGGTAETVGVLLASFAAAQLLATPLLGRASDRHGRRSVIVISLGANVVAMLLFALAASRHALWLLFASRMLAGATSGNIGACQAAIADVATGPERARAMGKLGAGIGLGMMLGPWIGGRASKLGEAAPPLFAAAMALVALVGVLVFMKETNPAVLGRAGRDGRETAPRGAVSFAALAANPLIAAVGALYFMTFLYMTTLQTALALLAAQRFHWTKDHVGDLFGLFGLVTLIVQSALVGPIAQRVAPVHLVRGAGLLAAAALACIAFSPVSAVMLVGLVLMATALGLTQPLLASLASQYAGEAQQGAVLGLAQSSGSLARAIGPLLWGAIYQHVSPTAAFLGGSVAALGASAVTLRLRETDAATKPTPE
ncbi:MAG: MFS transporter [Myxococcales bacterium]|nr:MAG: MFS transporter [Myxococcales bacterium]